MNKEIASIISSIKSKIQVLLIEKEAWHKEKGQLEKNLQQALLSVKTKDEEIIQLNEKLKALLMLQQQLPEADKKELSKSIDQHIVTIEKTITLLSE